MLTHLQNKMVSKSNFVLSHFVITFIHFSVLIFPAQLESGTCSDRFLTVDGRKHPLFGTPLGFAMS